MRSLMVAAVTVLFSSQVMAQQAADQLEPEAATSAALVAKASNSPVQSKKWMVAAANPNAVRAGAEVLASGGSAADAAVAVQLVLGLVEPQSSGLGGGAFALYYDAKSKKLTTLDGRETAPLSATPMLFLGEDGEPLKFFDAVVGGRSVGTPGTPALLGKLHELGGKKEWAALFGSAISLAEGGFQVSPRLAGLVKRDQERLSVHPDTAAYFIPGGTPIAEGTKLTNAQYAGVLKSLAAKGAGAFYKPPISTSVIEAVRNVKNNPGDLTQADFDNYHVKERQPVCVDYRAHQVCGMGPPSSGGLTVGQILGLIAPYDVAALGHKDANAWRLIGDASRLAFADRGRYMADSDYVPLPTKGLIDPAYLSARAKLLDRPDALKSVAPGEPKWDHAHLLADDDAIELPSTSHFSIVDGEGNIVSMTTTIENGFGSRLMASGMLLNNELTDFSFRSHRDGVPVANRVEPGKRPRSSMAPTIVMKDGDPVLAIGSPGGSRIIGYVAKTIIAHIDWGMNIQQAISLPHAVNRFGTFDLEAGTSAEELDQPLKALGFETNVRGLTSGLHGIVIRPDGLSGGADPRREGIVIGGG
ncbi:MAG: gamma-glutamyltransferase [Pseudomonadota bacterium]